MVTVQYTVTIISISICIGKFTITAVVGSVGYLWNTNSIMYLYITAFKNMAE